MSTNNQTQQTPDEAVDDQTPETPEVDEQTSGNTEAARYRRRMRDAEKERDQLHEQRSALTKALIETRIGQLTPKAFWTLAAMEPTHFLADDGSLDTTAVDNAVANVTHELQSSGIGGAPVIPNQAKQPDELPTGSFTDAFRPTSN